MNRKELHPLLQKEYSAPKQPFGVEKGKRDPYKNTWFVIPPAPPEKAPESLHLKSLGEAHRVLRELPLLKELNSVDQMILGLLVRRDALASSRMEGTWSTIDHVLTPGELHQRGEKSGNASVRGYAEALEKVYSSIEKKTVTKIDEKILQQLHKGIMGKDPNFRGKPGQFRHEAKPASYVVIGGFPRSEDSIYNPAPPGQLKKHLNNFCEWISDELLIEMGNAGQGLSLPLRMAFGHIYFEALHPFTDGNGRVGRMVMALQMMLDGLSPLYISGYIEMKKKQYNETLGAAQKKMEYAPFVRFLCEAISGSWEESQRSKMVLGELPSRWRDRAAFRKNSAADNALELLLSHPILTSKTLQRLMRVSAPAANNALAQLTESRILRERTGFGRNRVFAAEEVIAILGRPLDETPESARDQALQAMA